MWREENIISAVIHVDETAHLHRFCAVDQAGNLSAKDVIGDKNAQDAREIS